MTTPTASCSDSLRASRTSRPLIRIAPGGGVVEARHERGDGGLAGAARADEGDQLARLDGERHVVQHRAAAAPVTRGGGLERGQRDLVGGRVARRTPRRPRRARVRRAPRRRVGRLGDERLEVEHLEDPLEGDQRGHDVDPDVRDRGERAVEPGQQGGEGEQGADGEGVVDGHQAPDAVDHRRGERGDEGERDEEDRRLTAMRTPMSRTRRRGRRTRSSSSAGRPNSLTSRAPATLKRSVIRVPTSAFCTICSWARLASRRPISRAGTRKNGTSTRHAEGQLPGQRGHRDDDQHQRDDVADDAGEHRGEGLLGTDDVVVQPGDERAGLGAGEEGDRLAQHVGEHLGAQVVDEALTDAGGEPALDEGQAGAEDGDQGHEQGQPDDDRGVLGVDAVVDERLQQQRRGHHEHRLDDHDAEEPGDLGLVGGRVSEHPTGRAGSQASLLDAGVPAQAVQRLPPLHAHRSCSSSSSGPVSQPPRPDRCSCPWAPPCARQGPTRG